MDDLHARRLAALAAMPLERSELATVLGHVTRVAQQLLPADHAGLLLWDDDAETFTVSASTIRAQHPRYVLETVRTSGGASRWIVDHQRPLAVGDIVDDPFVASKMLTDHDFAAYLGVPLVFEGTSLGVLYALDGSTREYAATDVDFLTIVAQRAASAIGFARRFEHVQELARTDELTGLLNRREFTRAATSEFDGSIAGRRSVAAIVLDIDGFKDINDRLGHLAGDRVLVAVTRRCRDHLRASDLFGRLGGEEFAVLLPDADLETARHVAERIRQAVAGEPVAIGSMSVCVTITLGVAHRRPDIDHLDVLLDGADTAMLRGKRAGRDCVVVDDLGGPPPGP